MKHIKASFNSFTKTQKLFISFFLIGIFANLFFDVVTYYHLNTSTEAGHQVTRSHDILDHLRKLDEAVDKHSLGEKGYVQDIHREIEYLKKVVKNSKVQSLLAQLSTEIGQPHAVSTVLKMMDIESDLLRQRTEREIFEDESYEMLLSRVLFADGALLGLMLTFFALVLREGKRSELNLNVSLNNIREANSALEAEIVRRSNKLKMTAHDLRNPLGTISGFASLITDEDEGGSLHAYSEAIKRISSNSLRLIDSMLASDDGKLDLQKMDVLSLLKDLCFQNKILAADKQQTLFFESNLATAQIMGDQIKIEELLVNLIGNAIKYSPLGGKIWVRCFAENEKLCIEVEDQGAGFSDDDKKLAFRFGEKLSARPTANESSTGIGLYVVKRIVDLHQGKIEILDSKTGRGTCMHLELSMNL